MLPRVVHSGWHFKLYPHPRHQQCADEAQKAQELLSAVSYIHVYIYIYIFFFIALTFNIHLTMAEVRSKRRLFPLIFIFKIFPNILDIDCFSHTLDHVGAKFNTTILTKFINHWFLLFACSPLANFRWKIALEQVARHILQPDGGANGNAPNKTYSFSTSMLQPTSLQMRMLL